jgi:hypothetical protein
MLRPDIARRAQPSHNAPYLSCLAGPASGKACCVAASRTADLDPEVIHERARALLDARAAAILPLAAARRSRHAKRAELEAAERTEVDAYREAERAGWTPQELKELGFEAPEKRPRGRPRRSQPAPVRRATPQAAAVEARPGGGDAADGDD